jgi:TetR/AcrR family fatty acid metabolism transcriptional regulator
LGRVTAEAQARRQDLRRSQILEAAARVFARRGFDRATITEIARAARLSEGSIYNYFRSKEDLLIHIPTRVIQPILLPLTERAPVPVDEDDLEQLLLTFASGIVQRVPERARFLKVFLSALPSLSPAAREKYLELLPVYAAGVLEEFLRDGIRRGLLRPDVNPVIAARILPGMLLIFVIMQEVLLGRRVVPYDYADVVREAVRIFLHGAAAQPSRDGGGRRRKVRRSGPR